MAARSIEVPVEKLEVSAYQIPTDFPEADGTLSWDATTLVLVTATGGGKQSLGYTYGNKAVATLIAGKLTEMVVGQNAMAITSSWQAMVKAIRNLGRPGICSMAIAAVDTALWDLKARLLDLPLVALLGAARAEAPIYGSGGFTSYSSEQLQKQLSGWVSEGMQAVKMKVGSQPHQDPERVRLAREAIGEEVALFVDGNGAYGRKQALALAEAFAQHRVTWFEEPVSSDDLEGLRLLRDRGPAGMDIAAGEYGYDQYYFRHMLAAGAVDVLQADATRCGGITGFMAASALCQGYGIPLSAHTAPSLHAHAVCALPHIRPLEYFHDHARIEAIFFDGVLKPVNGALKPDTSRPGLGLELRQADAAQYAM
ncbi:enolase C-terminal domain-like protein [Nitrosococcus watsonii]|uniref:Mandelate racemase/muconate lactonizing protein n=1 Tax=Nitrosococcus watsoni (strain C-113) TaxID=105559 RepID=D8KA53_NITWC|nr:enolase C-terminal domain-like protein [Nitrosococcus watsonii]ADJ29411.1 Mandelate racemase/muconate lactonizing protein [Nitrosococcus watsonii C-113]